MLEWELFNLTGERHLSMNLCMSYWALVVPIWGWGMHCPLIDIWDPVRENCKKSEGRWRAGNVLFCVYFLKNWIALSPLWWKKSLSCVLIFLYISAPKYNLVSFKKSQIWFIYKTHFTTQSNFAVVIPCQYFLTEDKCCYYFAISYLCKSLEFYKMTLLYMSKW